MIRPDVLASHRPYGPGACRGTDVWDALQAARAGDGAKLRTLLQRDPRLVDCEYWYTQPIHFAVRSGSTDAVRVLLEAGASADVPDASGESLATVARDRGHEAVARLLESESKQRAPAGSTTAPADHAIHAAASDGDAARVGALLDAEPGLIHRRDRQGATALHRAVAASSRATMQVLLDRGADVHALHGDGPGAASGYAAVGAQPIDLALFRHFRGDVETAQFLVRHGATVDVTIAAALGDLEQVRSFLDADPERIRERRACGRRPLSVAVQFEHVPIVSLLLERGADANAEEGRDAPQGLALYLAARAGNRELADLLLRHGADPNAGVDSAGSPTFAARTPELRAFLVEQGGRIAPYDLVWLGEDEEALRRVAADPGSAAAGCGGVLAAACKMGKLELVRRLLDAGARVPAVLTECRSYLWSEPDSLRLLLASGMDPDLPDWLAATPLHDLCGLDRRGRSRPHRVAGAEMLLAAGAAIDRIEEADRSTPLGWAARNGLDDMVDLLLRRGAMPQAAGSPWATPLAWASRRGHAEVGRRLRAAGARA